MQACHKLAAPKSPPLFNRWATRDKLPVFVTDDTARPQTSGRYNPASAIFFFLLQVLVNEAFGCNGPVGNPETRPRAKVILMLPCRKMLGSKEDAQFWWPYDAVSLARPKRHRFVGKAPSALVLVSVLVSASQFAFPIGCGHHKKKESLRRLEAEINSPGANVRVRRSEKSEDCVCRRFWMVQKEIFNNLYWLRSYRRMQVGTLIGFFVLSLLWVSGLTVHILDVWDHLHFCCHETWMSSLTTRGIDVQMQMQMPMPMQRRFPAPVGILDVWRAS